MFFWLKLLHRSPLDKNHPPTGGQMTN